MSKLEITSHERNALRAAAHPLRPVVLIGDRGLSESVLKEIDQNLKAHHLIKVRASGQERSERHAMLETICNTLACAPVHHLGKTLVIYRPDPAQKHASDDFPNATRAVRKPNEPYTPKKLAAEGVKKTRKAFIAERAARKTEKLRNATARTRHTDAPLIPRSIPRRAGSALSLRAGARRARSR